jgi:hypothetical protein
MNLQFIPRFETLTRIFYYQLAMGRNLAFSSNRPSFSILVFFRTAHSSSLPDLLSISHVRPVLATQLARGQPSPSSPTRPRTRRCQPRLTRQLRRAQPTGFACTRCRGCLGLFPRTLNQRRRLRRSNQGSFFQVVTNADSIPESKPNQARLLDSVGDHDSNPGPHLLDLFPLYIVHLGSPCDTFPHRKNGAQAPLPPHWLAASLAPSRSC